MKIVIVFNKGINSSEGKNIIMKKIYDEYRPYFYNGNWVFYKCTG